MKRWVRPVAVMVGLGVLVLAVWSAVIGPVAAWRVLTHGTTTVWDHLSYPGREIAASPVAHPWPADLEQVDAMTVRVDGKTVPLNDLLAGSETLAFVVVRDGVVVHEWYGQGHDPSTPTMLFSVTKSIVSVLVGAAIDDGLIASVHDPVTAYIPELAGAGFDEVSVRDLLTMDTASTYVENDNPFGVHVRFNYTPDLEDAILGLTRRNRPDEQFTYRSGDSAMLGLVLARSLGDRSVSSYLQERLVDALGMEHGGMWSIDRDDGLERTWCCLAMTARDLARVGQLALDRGQWDEIRVVSAEWFDASLTRAYEPERWPDDYAASPLASYGYQWWLTDKGAAVALGKDGQYLHVDPEHRTVIVRLGAAQGDHSWLEVFDQISPAAP